jgi:hypothetical protein
VRTIAAMLLRNDEGRVTGFDILLTLLMLFLLFGISLLIAFS